MKHKLVAVFFVSVLILLALLSLFAAISGWVYVIVAGLWLAAMVIGSSFIGLNYHVDAYCAGRSGSDGIALTFDDGPNENTRDILSILKKHNAKATFFCIGQNIEKHPDIVREIIADGHLIGNHSYSHSHFFDFFGKQKVVAELQHTDGLIMKLTGKKPLFFRPPYGVTNPSIRRALQVTHHVVIGWSIRSMDGISKDSDAIFNRVARQLSPGAVVLLHDTRKHTTSVLERLLVTAAEKKIKIVAVDQLLELKAYEN